MARPRAPRGGVRSLFRRAIRPAALAWGLLSLLQGYGGHAWAQAFIEPVVLPHGTVTNTYSGSAANQTLINEGVITPTTKSFLEPSQVSEVLTSQTESYVRLYNPAAGSFATGRWIMRAASIRGLTPLQLRDRFALPAVPTYITNVALPTNAVVWAGTAGPIGGWGDGGAAQYRIRSAFPP